jgi:hypothetical protein
MATRLDPALRAYFQAMGQKGGRIGGKRSLETMTPEARRARASKAGAVGAAVKRAAAKARRAARKRTTPDD